MHYILDAWKSSSGVDATVGNLVGTLQKHQQTTEVIQELQAEFGKKIIYLRGLNHFVTSKSGPLLGVSLCPHCRQPRHTSTGSIKNKAENWRNKIIYSILFSSSLRSDKSS